MADNPLSAERIMRFRRATGMRVLESKRFLETADVDLVNRILAAYDQQVDPAEDRGHHLHDPIQDDPRYADAFAEAQEEADREVDAIVAQRRRELEAMGRVQLFSTTIYTAHLYEHTLKRILRERFGIDWKTLAEMNPGIIFD